MQVAIVLDLMKVFSPEARASAAAARKAKSKGQAQSKGHEDVLATARGLDYVNHRAVKNPEEKKAFLAHNTLVNTRDAMGRELIRNGEKWRTAKTKEDKDKYAAEHVSLLDTFHGLTAKIKESKAAILKNRSV